MNVSPGEGGRCGSASPPSVTLATVRVRRRDNVPILCSLRSLSLAERVGELDVLLSYRQSVVD